MSDKEKEGGDDNVVEFRRKPKQERKLVGGSEGLARPPVVRLNPYKIEGYKPGQNVIAKIAKPELGGFAVII